MDAVPARKSKSRFDLKRGLLLLSIAALLYCVLFIAAIHFAGKVDSATESDVIIVLGAGLRSDGRPGWALTRRSLQGAQLWQQGLASKLLCSGGKADSYPRSEAAACREVLMRQGVPASAILLEEQSRSTEENAIYSRRILQDAGLESVILVSDSYHMLRAGWLFGRVGISTTASPVPASRIRDTRSYRFSLLREFLAFHWHFFKHALTMPLRHIGGL